MKITRLHLEAAGAGALGALFIVALTFFLNRAGKSGDWAAWVQAAGVLLAMLVTWQAATRASDRERAARTAERLRFLKELRTAANAALICSSALKGAMEDLDILRTTVQLAALDDLSEIFARYRELNVSAWPTPYLAVATDRLGFELAGVRKFVGGQVEYAMMLKRAVEFQAPLAEHFKNVVTRHTSLGDAIEREWKLTSGRSLGD